MTIFDEIYDRTLLEKYGSDGEYIAMHQMDDSFQRLFMMNIVKECIEVVDKVYDDQTGMGAKLMRRATPYQEIINELKEHFGVEE